MKAEMIRWTRANIMIKGDVQMAGFRTFINNAADSLNVKGFADNLEDGSVKVVCEGKEEGINEFVNSIKENPPSFARIEEMNVAYEEYKGEFNSFERRGADIPKEEGAGENEMLALMRGFDKQDLMIEKQDSMLDKQDETIKEIKGFREDLRAYMEERFERIEREIEAINAKIGVF